MLACSHNDGAPSARITWRVRLARHDGQQLRRARDVHVEGANLKFGVKKGAI